MPATADLAAMLSPMLSPDRTALLVVDVQSDFAAPEGAMGRIGHDLSAASAAIACTQALLAAARAAGGTVAFARVVSRPETDTEALRLFMLRRGRDPAASLAICRDGTEGCAYYRVAPEPGELQVEKTLFSCFVGTGLDALLRGRGVDTLLLCGLTTDCCVDCTARDAFHRGYNVFIAADACAAYDEETHRAALHGLAKNCALLVETDAVVAAWRWARAA